MPTRINVMRYVLSESFIRLRGGNGGLLEAHQIPHHPVGKRPHLAEALRIPGPIY